MTCSLKRNDLIICPFRTMDILILISLYLDDKVNGKALGSFILMSGRSPVKLA